MYTVCSKSFLTFFVRTVLIKSFIWIRLHYLHWSFVHKFCELNRSPSNDCFTINIKPTPLWHSRNYNGAKSKYRKFFTSKSVLVLYHSIFIRFGTMWLFFVSETKNEVEGKASRRSRWRRSRTSRRLRSRLSINSKEDFQQSFLKLYDIVNIVCLRKGYISNNYK